MDSSGLRLLIALLFGAFLLITVISDLAKRRRKEPKVKARQSGFQRGKPVTREAGRPQQSWKLPRR